MTASTVTVDGAATLLQISRDEVLRLIDQGLLIGESDASAGALITLASVRDLELLRRLKRSDRRTVDRFYPVKP